MAVSSSQSSSRSGFSRHGFPPAPKSVRLWPVIVPSREHDELAPDSPRTLHASRHKPFSAWLVQLAVILAILAGLGALRLLPVIQSYLAK